MYLSSVASCGNTFSDEISCLYCGVGVLRCVQASKIDCAILTSSTKGRKEMADAIQGRISIPGLGPREACRGLGGCRDRNFPCQCRVGIRPHTGCQWAGTMRRV